MPHPPQIASLPSAAEDGILEECKTAMLLTQRRIAEAVYHKPDWAFAEVPVPGKGAGHVTTRIDLVAEKLVRQFLRSTRYRLKVEGEETPRRQKLNLGREKDPVVIVDMIDGTDLFTRELGNWCSAMVVLHPRRPSPPLRLPAPRRHRAHPV